MSANRTFSWCTSRRPIRRRISSAISSARAGLARRARGAAARFGGTVEADVPLRGPRSSASIWRRWTHGTTLVVLSDHGFALGALPDDPSTMRDMRRVSERYHRPDGILYLYGAQVRRARLDRPASARRCADAAGARRHATGRRHAGTRADGGHRARRSAAVRSRATKTGPPSRPTRCRRRRDGRSRHPRATPRARLPGRDVAQGRSHACRARTSRPAAYAEAAAAYRRLVDTPILPTAGCMRASPVRSARSVATTRRSPRRTRRSGWMPLEARAITTVLSSSSARAGATMRSATIAPPCNAMPSHTPSREALQRLTGSPLANPPRTDAERLAGAMADQASAAARRGDYDGATRLLDRAARDRARLPASPPISGERGVPAWRPSRAPSRRSNGRWRSIPRTSSTAPTSNGSAPASAARRSYASPDRLNCGDFEHRDHAIKTSRRDGDRANVVASFV